jgi:Fe-S-cluster containining protein
MEPGMSHVKVNVKTPHGEIDGNVGIPHVMMTSVDLVRGALDMTSNLVGMAIEDATKKDLEISCRKGCSVCCNQVVPVSKPEAFFFLDLIRQKIPEDIRETVKGLFEAAALRIDETGIAARLSKPDLTEEDLDQIGDEYFKLGIRCPFLSNAGACGVHQFRPTVCREYNVVTPAELCADPHHNPVRVVMPAIKMSMVLARLYAQETGTEAELMPLVLAPAWAAEHDDERGPLVEGPELFGRFMGILARVGRPRAEDSDEAQGEDEGSGE